MVQTSYILIVTVLPEASGRLNVWPAGTVKELITTVVHLTAFAISFRDAIVPVHVAASPDAAGVGLPRAATAKSDEASRTRATDSFAMTGDVW